jgi:hypothetical protein
MKDKRSGRAKGDLWLFQIVCLSYTISLQPQRLSSLVTKKELEVMNGDCFYVKSRKGLAMQDNDIEAQLKATKISLFYCNCPLWRWIAKNPQCIL